MALGLLQPEIVGDQVKIKIKVFEKNAANLALLTGVLETFANESQQQSRQMGMKQIMLALHNYHDSFKSFPVLDTYRDDQGKPYLSWRVHILPFMEQQALYEQFHLDEPWDSPHNKKLVSKMPDIYAMQKDLLPAEPVADQVEIQPGHTTIVAPTGELTTFGGRTATRFQDMLDGTSNTVVVVEVKPEHAVPWTAPQDYQFDPKKPLSGIAVNPDGTWQAAFGDGSVQDLSAKLPAKTVLHLFQMKDGNVVNLDATE